MKKLITLIIIMMIATLGTAGAGEYTGRAVEAKFASEEIEGDLMTVWARISANT